MIQIIPLLIIGVAAAAASYFIKTSRTRTLASISDEEFIKLYRRQFEDPTDSILELKTFVAKHLALPIDRLAPDHTFKQLAKYTGFAGEYEVGMGDLESELTEAFARAGLEPPKTFPNTVAEFIHEMLKANSKQGSDLNRREL